MTIIDIIPGIVDKLDISRNDLVLIQLWGENKDLILLDNFSIEVARKGGIPFKMQHSRNYYKKYFSSIPQYDIGFGKKYFDIFRSVNIVIDLMTYPPTPSDDFPRDRLSRYNDFMKNLFSNLSFTGKGNVQIKFPTKENAEAVGVEYKLFNKGITEALTVNYAKLINNCNILYEILKKGDNITIHTDYDRKLSFQTRGRKWIVENSTFTIPGGEILVSPIEGSVNGEILIPEIRISGIAYHDVILQFERGEIIKSSENDILNFIRSHNGDSGVFAEFGIGLNQGISEQINYYPLDKKKFGLAHISIGANKETGGNNNAQLRMNFLFTPFMVEVDRETLMEFGEFVDELGFDIDLID